MYTHDELNDRQKEAVFSTQGPLLILAGAGSGKTRTIIHRIAYIIQSGLAKPYQILALTFTNKAAGEMKTRITGFGIENVTEMWMGTFHSVCARLLRIHAEAVGFDRSFTIYDEDDSKALISQIVKESKITDRKISAGHIKAIISKAKEKMIDADEFENTCDDLAELGLIAGVYKEYQKRIKDNNAMDFDDLLLNTVRLFEQNEEILAHYQNRFQYILVDEYQDTNLLQYKIVSAVARKHNNICVCGDDDQSIYSWRGADIRNILEFEVDYPNAKVVKLEENYRSTKNILEAANALIKNNKSRKGKNLYTAGALGDKISLFMAMRDLEEAEHIASEIEEIMDEGENLSQVAVLYRINAQSRILEESLMRKRIPYQIIAGTRFYERMEVKDIMAYLKLASNNRDNVSFLRAVSSPRRGIGSVSLERIATYSEFKKYDMVKTALNAEAIPSLSRGVKDKLYDFGRLIVGIKQTAETSLSEAVTSAIYDSGYLNMLKAERNDRAQARIDNLNELINAAKDFEKTSEDASLEAFLENASLISAVDMSSDHSGMVKLMTVHNAKGLEFDCVFITGLEEGLFPLYRSIESEAELEEERRLCYVALTRAKKRLHLSFSSSRRLYSAPEVRRPSRFIDEIPSELIETTEGELLKHSNAYVAEAVVEKIPSELPDFTYRTKEKLKKKNKTYDFDPGNKIMHPVWGEGTVISVNRSGSDRIITAAFAGLGIKKFISEICEVKKI